MVAEHSRSDKCAYTPGPITLAAGILHREWFRCDTYAGEGEALIASGLVRQEMLPEFGCASMTWRPQHGERLDGESWRDVPGCMRITHHGQRGGYMVQLTIEREERDSREAEAERQEEERRRERAKHPARTENAAEHHARLIGSMHAMGELIGEHATCLSAADKRRVLELVQELTHVITKAQIIIEPSRRPTPPKRGGLSLVWSAPE
jgi:hypothetical protein